MAEFGGKLAVITGAGSGIGRALALQLVAERCHIAICDLNAAALAETAELAADENPGRVRITSMVADASSAADTHAFAEQVRTAHESDHVDLLFNNAGIGGGESFVVGDQAEWERTFDTCWGSVYRTTRAFMPLLMASTSADIINVSSLNGFYAALGPTTPVSAYASAKFAVKGFTEALITDLSLYAPHVRATLVMPGHVGSSISVNTRAFHGRAALQLTPAQLDEERRRLLPQGFDFRDLDDDRLRQTLQDWAESFEREGLLTPAEAASIILDGVRAGRWRILVGDDAIAVDRFVRRYPNVAYTSSRRRFQALVMSCYPPRSGLRRVRAALAAKLRRR